MAQGKYTNSRHRRRLNPRFVMLVLLLVALVAFLGTLMLHSCRDESVAESAPSSQATTAPATKPTTAPTTKPTTVPTTAPTTEPVTEPSTEAPTEPVTEPPTEAPTEPVTEPPTEAPTEATEPPVPVSSSQGAQIAQTAIEQLGKPFAYGGVGPDSFDASGLAVYCYGQSGITIPRTTDYQMDQGVPVPTHALEPGDIVIFWIDIPGEPEYEGIYVGNGKFIAARSGDKPVSEIDLFSGYFAERYLCARRFY